MTARRQNHRFIVCATTNLKYSWSTKHDEAMAKLYNLQEELYSAGARNFLFIDVPPIARSPAGLQSIQRKRGT